MSPRLELRRPRPASAKQGGAPAPSQNAASTLIGPPLTSFDFLSGGYARASRTRLASLVVVGAVAVGALTLTASGVTTMLHTRSVNSEITQVQTQTQSDTQQLAKVASAGGVGQPALEQEVSSRKAAADQAVTNEVAAYQVLQNVEAAAAAVPGAQISSVSFATTGQPGTTSAAVNQPTAAVSPTSQSPSLPVAVPTPTTTPAVGTSGTASGTTLTITLTLSSYADVQTWTSALATKVPYLANPVQGTTVSGSSGKVAVTTTGPLAAAMSSLHLNAINGELTVTLPGGG